MNTKWFKCKLKEEFDDAKEYVKYAIEIKAMNPSWAAMLLKMSSNELEHAQNVYKMFTEYFTTLSGKYKEMPEYINETKSCMDEMFTIKITEVKMLHSAYEKL